MSIPQGQALPFDLSSFRYKNFVFEGVGKKLLDEVKNHLYLGSDDFVSKTMHYINRNQDLLDISEAQYTEAFIPLSLLEYEQHAKTRDEAILLAFNSGAYTLREIGLYFGLHYSRVSRIVRAEKAKGKA